MMDHLDNNKCTIFNIDLGHQDHVQLSYWYNCDGLCQSIWQSTSQKNYSPNLTITAFNATPWNG
jgi:hypothetical protein